MMNEFVGKVALITGGGSGIGEATARAFADAGASVVIADIRHDAAKIVASSIKAAGRQALAIELDIADDQQVAAAIRETIATFGKLDIAFNNAGVIETEIAPLQQRSSSDFDRIFNVNVRGLFNCLRSEIAAMLRAGSGTIVNNASIAGAMGVGGIGLYSASKHAIIGMSKSAALETAASGIRINAILPDGTRTGMFAQAETDKPEAFEVMRNSIPMKRWAEASEQAGLVLFLCSSASSYITGATIANDGGRLAGSSYLP